MQQLENDEKQPVAQEDPQSQPFPNVPLTQDEDNDDPDAIFMRAVAEIDTQPLRRKSEPFTIGEVVEVCLLVSVFCFSFMGIVWQCITYPHTLVVLYTKANPASITTMLDLPIRTVAPVTLTRAATTATTGTGHQDAQAASGILTFYNGNFAPQSIPRGTVFTGHDGVRIATNAAVIVPAAQPPQFAIASVAASALNTGNRTNIAAGDIHLALSNDFLVKNLTSFTGGRDARTFKAVAAQDLETLTTTVNETLTKAFTTAFSLQPGEAAIPTNCHVTTTANHQLSEEAQSVTLTASKTCSAVAYNQDELTRTETAAFTKTRPRATYHLVGNVEMTLKSVTPFTVALSGKWAYTFSPDYQELLVQVIQGNSPAKAKAYLLKTGVISYASVPHTLPSAEYINFLVLVG